MTRNAPNPLYVRRPEIITLIVETQSLPLQVDQDGVVRVGGTRVTLDTVAHAFNDVNTAEEIMSHYPVLKLADIYAVISYYLNNRAAVNSYLQQQENSAEKTWLEIESAPDYQLFRHRLLARRAAREKSSQQRNSQQTRISTNALCAGCYAAAPIWISSQTAILLP